MQEVQVKTVKIGRGDRGFPGVIFQRTHRRCSGCGTMSTFSTYSLLDTSYLTVKTVCIIAQGLVKTSCHGMTNYRAKEKKRRVLKCVHHILLNLYRGWLLHLRGLSKAKYVLIK